MPDYTIYRIVCFVTGMVYVGQTVNVRQRRSSHFSELKNNTHRNQHLQNAYNLYGSRSFYFEVLEKHVSAEIVNEREQHWIAEFDSFRNGFNKSAGGNNYDHFGIPCEWNGISYSSISAAANACGVLETKMRRWLNKKCSCDADVFKLPHPNGKSCEWNGKQYSSISDAARDTGHTLGAMHKYIRQGFTGDADKPRWNAEITWNGITYPTIKIAAKACGIAHTSFRERLQRGYTCDADMAINKPKRE